MVKSDIGIIGLAVMGENLALNLETNGFVVSVYNRTDEKTENFIRSRCTGRKITGFASLDTFCLSLKRPRKVMMMVRAGQPVDDLISRLVDILEPGDIIIDGGNSNFHDTARRTELAESCGLLYVGTGVSGGDEGALHGPSLMPGGSAAAWVEIRPIFQKICAKAPDGSPCCDWIGSGGAGHYVKMVHNGIEYGDMQLICEAYQLMRDYLGMDNDEMSRVFRRWNSGALESYLIKITADILAFRDDEGAVIDRIEDRAGQKGTGKWTVQSALELGEPLSLITEAVFARCISSKKNERVMASGLFGGFERFDGDREEFLRKLEMALYAAKIVSYAQGYSLMRSAAVSCGWQLDYGRIALMWRGGCIIRSAFLEKIRDAYEHSPMLENLLFDDHFRNTLRELESGWRSTVSAAVQAGIPVPAFSSALSYYDSLRCAELPANLLQAQRDYFGAHTYERRDRPEGEHFHTDWNGTGGAASENYSV